VRVMPGEIVTEGAGLATIGSVRQLAEEFLLVHAVFECLASVDEDYGNFVVVLTAEFGIGVNVDVLPCETAAARKFREALFHYFAEMTSLA
jgi:hypothetical protein